MDLCLEHIVQQCANDDGDFVNIDDYDNCANDDFDSEIIFRMKNKVTIKMKKCYDYIHLYIIYQI